MTTKPFETSEEHLHKELERIQALLEFRVRAQLKFQPQADQLGFSGQLSNSELERLLHLSQQPEAVHATAQRIPEELQDIFDKVRQTAAETADRRKVTQSTELLRLDQLCRACWLTPLEQDVILVCLLSMLNPNTRPLFAYLNQKGNQDWPTPESISGILAPSYTDVQTMRQLFAPHGRLIELGLLSLMETDPDPFRQRVVLSQEVVSFLFGQYVIQPPLNLFASYHNQGKPLADLLLPSASEQTIMHLVQRYQSGLQQAQETGGAGVSLLVAMDGYSPADHLMVAEGIAQIQDQPLLHVQLDGMPQRPDFEQLFKRLLLWTRLTQQTIFLSGCERLAHAADDARTVFQRLITQSLGLILFDKQPILLPLGQQPSVILLSLDKRNYQGRLQLWQNELANLPLAADVDQEQLANVYQLDASQIEAAVRWAKGAAFLNGQHAQNGTTAIHQADLQKGARLQSDTALAQQAELITINHDWNDLILPPETIHQLREIYLRIKHRARVFELWGLGKKVVAKHGLSVLFAGPSGTGKTMAAGIIANGLGQDLYRVDLSTMVSKYIGETEKNLNKIFEAAEQSNAVLFFDEADAIFGKRSDVKDSHDRYANLQVAYLLQRMETFSGIAILATNLIANTDDAFIRRLDFIVAFPEPEANQRKQIWQHHLESSGKLPLGSIDYQFLADHFHMTGGLIRNAVVHAAFLAAEDGGVVQMIHLLQAVKREYQKQRRLVDEALFAEFTPASPEL